MPPTSTSVISPNLLLQWLDEELFGREPSFTAGTLPSPNSPVLDGKPCGEAPEEPSTIPTETALSAKDAQIHDLQMKVKCRDLKIECQDLKIENQEVKIQIQEVTIQIQERTIHVLRRKSTRSRISARRLQLRLNGLKKQLQKRNDDAVFGRRTLERLEKWKGVFSKDCKNMLMMDTCDIDEEAAAEESDSKPSMSLIKKKLRDC